MRRHRWVPHAAGAAGVAVLICGLAAASIRQERVSQRERAVFHARTTAHLLEATVAGMLDKVDAMLIALAVEASDATGGDALQGAGRLIEGALRTTPEVSRWAVCGSDGQPLRMAGQGRGSPCAGQGTPPAEGAQWRGPLQREPGAPWVIELSRAFPPGEGGRGRVVAEMPVNQFEFVLGGLLLGTGGAATLRTAELALVWRHPAPPDLGNQLGRSVVSAGLRAAVTSAPSEGVYETATQLDGIERINAYRRLRRYPLYLLVGLPARDYPRGWNGLDLSVLTLAGMTVLLAMLSAVALYRASERRLAAAARRFDALVASSNDAIVSKTLQGIVTSWNAAAERIFGWRAEQMIGQPVRRMVPAELLHEEEEILARLQRGERVTHFDTERLHADGRRIPVSVTISPLLNAAGQTVGASLIARDISRQKAMEAELRSLAFHDALTRLPNRRLFLDRLRHAQEASQRSGSHAGVLFVDLDHFKHLNDRHGHDMGDLVLVEVAQRLRQGIRESDTVARLGGDEFVVLCEHLGDDRSLAEEALQHMAAKLGAVLSRDYRLGRLVWHHGASIGHHLFLGTEEDPDALLRDADRVMYREKERRHSVHGALTEQQR